MAETETPAPVPFPEQTSTSRPHPDGRSIERSGPSYVDRPPAPVEFLEPYVYDFGEVEPDRTLPFRVRLRNTSDRPLAILRVVWRSGTPPSLAAVVPPQAVYEFEIAYRSPRRSGESEVKTFVIVFEEYAPLTVRVRLTF